MPSFHFLQLGLSVSEGLDGGGGGWEGGRLCWKPQETTEEVQTWLRCGEDPQPATPAGQKGRYQPRSVLPSVRDHARGPFL